MRRADYFSRYDKIARLGNRTIVQDEVDVELEATLRFGTIALCIVVIALFGTAVACLLFLAPVPPQPIPAPQAIQSSCLTCHFTMSPPTIKSYGEYRRKHQIKVRPVDLAELVQP